MQTKTHGQWYQQGFRVCRKHRVSKRYYGFCNLNHECYTRDEQCNGVEDPGFDYNSLDLAVSGSVGGEGTIPRDKQNAEND